MKAIQRAEAGAYWIAERGPRHGNNRKWIAREKVLVRKRKRAKEKREALKELCPIS